MISLVFSDPPTVLACNGSVCFIARLIRRDAATIRTRAKRVAASSSPAEGISEQMFTHARGCLQRAVLRGKRTPRYGRCRMSCQPLPEWTMAHTHEYDCVVCGAHFDSQEDLHQ